MKNYHVALMIMSALVINNIIADEIEEVIVTSSYIDQALTEIENPLHVLSGDDVSSIPTQSLGELIDNLVGVSSTDYGSGVGQPIIRGMSGNRVKILNNGMVVRDVSGLGADHINDIDLNNIQQIEVVRGPSSLLYSNGSIGGIINVVDNTITRKDFTEPELRIGLETQSVNDGDTHDYSYQNNIAGFNLSLAYKDSQFGNFDIPHGAALHTEDEHGEDDHDEEEGHDENLGYLPNSDYESTSKRFGLSKIGDWGYFGLSVNNIESLYGIPFHGEGHEEHEGEEHEKEEHENKRIFSTTESDAFNIEGSYVFNNSLLQKVDYFFRNSDYSLTEQHEEEDHTEEAHDEHDEEGPTLFKNDAREYGAIFDLTNNSFSQKMVLNFIEEDISIIGAEAYMNPSNNKERSIGYYLSKELDLFHIDFGIRHDQIKRNGSLSHEEHEEEEHEDEIEYFNRNIKHTSFALSLGRDINKYWDVNFGLSRVERAPSAVELFMNGPHLATSRFEVGNTDLKSETSNNIDLTFNYENYGFYGHFTFFRNNVDNYIYLLDETEEEHEEEEHEEEYGNHEGLILANYLQNNVQLDGYEFEFGRVIELERGNLALSFAIDSVSGEFKNGGNIPRMVPSRNIYSMSYSVNDLEFRLNLKDVKEQRDIGVGETKTDGYQMLDVLVKQTFNLSNQSNFSLSLFANNLLDEVARNHTSFVKNEIPLAGRNYGIRFNYQF